MINDRESTRGEGGEIESLFNTSSVIVEQFDRCNSSMEIIQLNTRDEQEQILHLAFFNNDQISSNILEEGSSVLTKDHYV